MTNRPVRRIGRGSARAGDDGGAEVHFNYGPLNRVVNVHWGGGVFVAGGVPDNYYGSKNNWQNLGPLQFDSYGYASASAFAKVGNKKVFVLGGQVNDGKSSIATGISRQGPMILSSNDGKTWNIAYEASDILTSSSSKGEYVTGIVWDNGRFYATLLATIIEGGSRYQRETLLQSVDGKSFSMADTRRHELQEDWSTLPSLIDPHCTKPANKNEIPDGYQAYNAGGEIFAKPQDLEAFWVTGAAYAEKAVSNERPLARAVTFTKTGHATTSSPTSMGCYAVAYSGGTWVAVGIEGIDIASSDGVFKNVVMKPDQVFATVCGG